MFPSTHYFSCVMGTLAELHHPQFAAFDLSSMRTGIMIIRGGENVYPREIEEFLYTYPKIADVQVVGLPDLRYGEELCAWGRLKPDMNLTEDEVRDFCKSQIAHYKVPRYVVLVDEYPTTVTGKVQMFKLPELGIARFGLQKAAGVETA